MAKREIKEIEVEIFWDDLSYNKQQELIEAGYDDQMVMLNIMPITTFFIEQDYDEEDMYEEYDEDDL